MASSMIPCNEGSTRRYKYRSSSSSSGEVTITPKLPSQSRKSSERSSSEEGHVRSDLVETTSDSVDRVVNEAATHSQEIVRVAPRHALAWPPTPRNDTEPDNCLEMRDWPVVGVDGFEEIDLPTHV